MLRWLIILLFAGLGFPSLRALAQEPDQAATLAEQVAAAVKEFNAEGYAFRQAKTDEERAPIIERVNRLTLKLLSLAEKNPDSPATIDCLVQTINQELWLENNTTHPGFGPQSPHVKAIAILLRDHLGSDKLAESTRRVQYGFRPECETFLRTVAEKSPHWEIRGLSSLRLAQFLNLRQQRVEILQLRPEMAKRYEGLFGKEFLDRLLHRDRAAALAEIEATFERAAKEYADVKLPYGSGTVGQKAASELYELRHLSVGKQAPEIAGEDQDGRPLALSDFRGKVVLLYFWSEY
ncbi:MAG: redoxin domain-containing protein [Pirellulaceae bacterium]